MTSTSGPSTSGPATTVAVNRQRILLAVGSAASRAVPESRDEAASGHFDWLGSGLVALAVGGLAFGAIRGRRAQGWDDPTALTDVASGLLASLATPLAMATRADPLVPPSFPAVGASPP